MTAPATITGITGAAIALVALLVSALTYLTNRRWRRASRLDKLHMDYATVVQPALAQLDALKTLHPGGQLWDVLQFKPPRDAAPSANDSAAEVLAKRQLRTAHMDLMVREQTARNAARGFWRDAIRDIASGALPAAFGRVRGGVAPGGAAAAGEKLVLNYDTWAYRANNFRELVEPFEIANYYRLGFDVDEGHYCEGKNRPADFRRIEGMWIAHKRKTAGTGNSFVYHSSVAWALAKQGVALQQPADAPPDEVLTQAVPQPADAAMEKALPQEVLQQAMATIDPLFRVEAQQQNKLSTPQTPLAGSRS